MNNLPTSFSEVKKTTLECLLRETLSQVSEAKRQNETSLSLWDENKNYVKKLQKSVNSGILTPMSHQCLLSILQPGADAVQKSLA